MLQDLELLTRIGLPNKDTPRLGATHNPGAFMNECYRDWVVLIWLLVVKFEGAGATEELVLV